MSAPLIIQDSLTRPDLFHWFGPIAPETLKSWLTEHHLDACAPDLCLFWEQTGGGDLLESETILGPFGDPEMGDAVVPANRDLRLSGLPDGLVVFHVGATTSAVDLRKGDYVEINSRDYRRLRGFHTFDEWYSGTIRHVLGGRYGLR